MVPVSALLTERKAFPLHTLGHFAGRGKPGGGVPEEGAGGATYWARFQQLSGLGPFNVLSFSRGAILPTRKGRRVGTLPKLQQVVHV